MKKLFNITRNICFAIVLCYLTYQAINVFKPQLIEEYLVLNHDVQNTSLGIANMESFSLQEETSISTLPKKLRLKNRSHQVYFHPSELIRADIYDDMVTLYLVNNQQLSIKISLEEVWELFEQHNLSKSFWKNPTNILNLSHTISIKSQNVSEIPKEENTTRGNDYRLVITFSNQDVLRLRKNHKKDLESALNNYFSNPD